MSVGKKIRSLRLHRKLTIREISAQVGVPPTTYREWEHGRKMSADKLLAVAAALDVSLAEILGDDNVNRANLRQVTRMLEESLQILRKV